MRFLLLFICFFFILPNSECSARVRRIRVPFAAYKTPPYYDDGRAHYWRKDYLSPDRKYLAHVIMESGTIGLLDVYRLRGLQRNVRHQVLNGVLDVNSFLWLPERHTLVYACGGNSQGSYIAIWDDKRPRRLRQVVNNYHVKSGNYDCFEVQGLAATRKTLLFRYFNNGTWGKVERLPL